MRNRLCNLVAGLLICTVTTVAHAACNGEDLYARLSRENPVMAEQATALAAKTINGNALLWRIEKAGTAPSHLFGTIHLTDPRVTTLNSQVKDALSGSKIIASEVIYPETTAERATADAKILPYLIPQPGESILDILSSEETIWVSKRFEDYGYTSTSALGLWTQKPWTLGWELAIPPCEYRQLESGHIYLGELIQSIDRENGARIVGLESVTAYFEAVDRIPRQAQKAWFLETMSMIHDVEDMYESDVRLWTQRRPALSKAWFEVYSNQFSERYLSEGLGKQEFYDAIMIPLLDIRNIGLANASIPLINEGGAFISVAYGHLSGTQGLVEMYRAAGYQLTPVW